ALGRVAIEHGEHQVLFAGEIGVDGARREAGGVGDSGDGGAVESLLQEGGRGRGEDALTGGGLLLLAGEAHGRGRRGHGNSTIIWIASISQAGDGGRRREARGVRTRRAGDVSVGSEHVCGVARRSRSSRGRAGAL